MTQTLTPDTFTNEQLRDIAEGAMLTQLQDKIMARELLANREAKPVQAPFMHAICNPDGSAWLDENCVAGTAEELKPVLNDLRRDTGDGFRIVPLFTAPPAPVVNPEFTGATAVPDGFCIMPLTLTAANGAKGALSGEFKVSLTVTCNECGGDGCMDCNDRGEFEEEITVPWSTIKDIYRAAVDACRAAMLAQPVSSGYTLPDDTRRMDWLVSHHVAVRQPLVYGSYAMFTAQQVSDDHEEHKTDLREQIDAAMLAAAPEGGNDPDTRR
ncbi:MAG: hypothetical protein WCD24_03830 [Serratia inhibens]|uniref:hypothetical protein n=1 Tax=Serratia inhibens TaxID=2338073 RepID=UPI003C7BE5FF